MSLENIKSKKDLMRVYKISYPTLRRWLKSVPGLDLSIKKSYFTPRELELIYSHIGKPEI
jgi:hypothetical protein